MKPALVTGLAQERGTLTARATLEDPDVRLDAPDGAAPTLTIEEGGVRVDLAFPDTDCIRRFQRRVGRVPVPPEDDDR
jgi:hypothetical protein